MFKQIRAIINPNWKTEAWYPGKNQLYQELQQSSMKSWLAKKKIMSTMTQTQDNQMIHQRNCKEMLIPRIKLQQQWAQRNHATLAQMDIRKQETKDQRYNPHAGKTAQTELIQYIAAHPEIPEDMDPGREERKKLAELTIEHPPNKSSQALAQQEETPPGQKKEIYMHQLQPTLQLNDRKVQPHHTIPRMPKCEPSETVGNKCKDCGRPFEAPVNLKEHQKFVRADLRTTMPTQENQNKRK